MPQTPLGVAESWRTVHQRLLAHDWQAHPAPERVDFAVYAHCAYAAFGRPADADLAHQLFDQLATAPGWQTAPAWPARQLDQACLAAWLAARLAAAEHAPARLAALDETLCHEALRLTHEADAASRSNFFRILRYFSLRLPLAAATQHLPLLLAELAAEPPAGAAIAEQLPLGLGAGLAAELLVLIKLSKQGLGTEATRQAVRQGIIRLLALRSPVDFEAQQFSVFPYQVHSQSGEATFGADLSWHRGDVGQAWLLHEAHEVLHNAELAKIAELVGLNTLLRTTIDSTEITSAQVDCGAAGVAHLYGKLHRTSGQRAYHQGQQFWLGQTQAWLLQELAAGPYRPGPAELRQGLVGTGLVLLSAVAEADLGWDAALL